MNFPFIYVASINNKLVKEKYAAEHGFNLAWYPIRPNDTIKFTSIPELFKLIRKYTNRTK